MTVGIAVQACPCDYPALAPSWVPLKIPLGDLESALQCFLRGSPCTPEGDKHNRHKNAAVARVQTPTCCWGPWGRQSTS